MTAPDIMPYLATISDAEAELLRLFSARAALTILDIGCCEGEDSVRYARRFPAARVFAFEPLPTNQELARANFERFRVANAELSPLALSDRIGVADFHVSSGRPPQEFAGADWNYGNKSSSLLSPADAQPIDGWIRFQSSIKVRTTTLDAFCQERAISAVDFIHMDVQGAEHLVLAGAKNILPRTGAIWLEVAERQIYFGQKIRPQIEAVMQRAGFSLTFQVSRGIEGDQFYVNRRHLRSWRHLASTRWRAALARARFLGGRWRAK
jgi:FkbM family methyltransferase